MRPISIKTRALVLFEHVSALNKNTKKILESVPIIGTGYSHSTNRWGPDSVYVYARVGKKGQLTKSPYEIFTLYDNCTSSFTLLGSRSGRISLVHNQGSFIITDKVVVANLIHFIKEGITVTEDNIKYVRNYIRNKTSWNNVLIRSMREDK